MFRTLRNFVIGTMIGYVLFEILPAWVQGFKEGYAEGPPEPDPTQRMCGIVLHPLTIPKILEVPSTMYDEFYLEELWSTHFLRAPKDLLVFIPRVANPNGTLRDGWCCVPMKALEKHFVLPGDVGIDGSNWQRWFEVDYVSDYPRFADPKIEIS